MKDCPIKYEIETTISDGQIFSKSLSNLRKKIAICNTCLSRFDCKYKENFNAKVDEIIHELNLEWGYIKAAKSAKQGEPQEA